LTKTWCEVREEMAETAEEQYREQLKRLEDAKPELVKVWAERTREYGRYS
jgi:hypothetical protein